MNVTEFTKLSVGNELFRIVDADKQGYMSSPFVLVEADKNVVRERFGNRSVIGFEIATKKCIILYTKNEE